MSSDPTTDHAAQIREALETAEEEFPRGMIAKALAALDSLEAHVVSLTAERDAAITHDRQPYPTAFAYEQVCKARDNWQARAVRAETALREIVALEVAEGDGGVGFAAVRHIARAALAASSASEAETEEGRGEGGDAQARRRGVTGCGQVAEAAEAETSTGLIAGRTDSSSPSPSSVSASGPCPFCAATPATRGDHHFPSCLNWRPAASGLSASGETATEGAP